MEPEMFLLAPTLLADYAGYPYLKRCPQDKRLLPTTSVKVDRTSWLYHQKPYPARPWADPLLMRAQPNAKRRSWPQGDRLASRTPTLIAQTQRPSVGAQCRAAFSQVTNHRTP